MVRIIKIMYTHGKRTYIHFLLLRSSRLHTVVRYWWVEFTFLFFCYSLLFLHSSIYSSFLPLISVVLLCISYQIKIEKKILRYVILLWNLFQFHCLCLVFIDWLLVFTMCLIYQETKIGKNLEVICVQLIFIFGIRK